MSPQQWLPLSYLPLCSAFLNYTKYHHGVFSADDAIGGLLEEKASCQAVGGGAGGGVTVVVVNAGGAAGKHLSGFGDQQRCQHEALSIGVSPCLLPGVSVAWCVCCLVCLLPGVPVAWRACCLACLLPGVPVLLPGVSVAKLLSIAQWLSCGQLSH